jgi:exodeoxyribonuclease-5
MDWSPQQEKALQQIDRWLDEENGQQMLRLFGYAGTGKTTLARTIADTIDGPVQFAAYTGKAASVMRAKGCATAQTLHSLVYTVDSFIDEEEIALRAALDLTEDPVQRGQIVRKIRAVVANANKHRWIVNRDGPLSSAALLILDECSMVDEKLGRDILSFNKPVLVLGDPGQLPPPSGAGFFTTTAPDALLTEVHRQAKENPIIRLATLAREGKPIRRGHVAHETGSATVTADREAFAHFDGQYLTGSNVIRRTLNWNERCQMLGTTTPPKAPQQGEPIIVLRNNKDLGIFNGVIGSMASTAVWTDNEDLRGDVMYEGRLMSDLFIDGAVFRQYDDLRAPQPPLQYDRDKTPLDFGYALTVHKAQGSEWDSVCLVDDGFGKRDPALRAQWLYTAITRASKDLMIYTGDL